MAQKVRRVRKPRGSAGPEGPEGPEMQKAHRAPTVQSAQKAQMDQRGIVFKLLVLIRNSANLPCFTLILIRKSAQKAQKAQGVALFQIDFIS